MFFLMSTYLKYMFLFCSYFVPILFLFFVYWLFGRIPACLLPKLWEDTCLPFALAFGEDTCLPFALALGKIYLFSYILNYFFTPCVEK